MSCIPACLGAESPTVCTSVGLIVAAGAMSRALPGSSVAGSGRSAAAIQSDGLFASAAGPRCERQGLVWLMERKGRDRDGLKEWAEIKDVARAATESCNRPESFPESYAGSPFLNGGSAPWVWSSRCGIEATASRVGRRFLPNSRIRPAIALLSMRTRASLHDPRIHLAGLRMFFKIHLRFLSGDCTDQQCVEGADRRSILLQWGRSCFSSTNDS